MRVSFAEETFDLRWNSVLTQVTLVGMVCFCEPGLYNSIIAMGGGINDPDLIATSNMIIYISFALSSLLAPALINLIGARWALTIGTVGYWVYVSSLFFYQSGRFGSWVVNAAAVAIGACAGPLWTAQNAICLAYPSTERKGQYFSVFWIVFNLGGVVGGVISLITNWSSSASSASGVTFLVFIVLMVCGTLLATTLARPENVERPDGTLVKIAPLPDFAAEARATMLLFCHREMILLTPLFAYTGWFYPYQFGVFNKGLFNARTQGLNNTFYWGAQMLGAHWIGFYLDSVPESGGRARRATIALLWLAVAIILTWLLALYFNLTRSLTVETRFALDFIDNLGEFIGPFALYVAWGFLDAFIQCYTYWIFGQLTTDVSTTARFSGYMKFVGCLAAATGWKLGVIDSTMQVVLNLGLFCCTIPSALMVARKLPDSDRKARRSVLGLEEETGAPLPRQSLTWGGALGARLCDSLCWQSTTRALNESLVSGKSDRPHTNNSPCFSPKATVPISVQYDNDANIEDNVGGLETGGDDLGLLTGHMQHEFTAGTEPRAAGAFEDLLAEMKAEAQAAQPFSSGTPE